MSNVPYCSFSVTQCGPSARHYPEIKKPKTVLLNRKTLVHATGSPLVTVLCECFRADRQ